MSKHAPGPWRVRSCETAVLVDVVRNGEAMLIALIADNDTEGDSENDRKMNNARLIAAAPQMLEALEMVVAWDDDPIGNALDIGAIKEAIKAAKGEN